MPFKSIQELIGVFISKRSFYGNLFAEVPKVYVMICTKCNSKFRNEHYKTVACPNCKTRGALIPDPSTKSIELRLDSDSKISFQIRYNPSYIENLLVTPESLEAVHALLGHLATHILDDHLSRSLQESSRRKPLEGQKDLNEKLDAIAADLPVNDFIIKQFENQTSVRKVLGPFPETYQFKNNGTLEVYRLLLEEMADKDSTQFQDTYDNAETHTDVHHWSVEEADGVPEGATEKKLKLCAQQMLSRLQLNVPEYLKKVIEEHLKQGGTLPGDLKLKLDGLIPLDQKIDWLKVLQSRIRSGAPSLRVKCLNKINRRMLSIRPLFSDETDAPSLFPGSKRDVGYKIVLIRDTSGSMSDVAVRKASGMLLNIQRYNPSMEIYIADADTEISLDTKGKPLIKKIETESDVKFTGQTRYGYGGTIFSKPLDQVEKALKPDVIIYFTDGYGTAPQKPPRAKLIWCLTRRSGAKIPASYGEVLWINA